MSNLSHSLISKPRRVILIVTGSVRWDFEQANEVINLSPNYCLTAQGMSPYFLDAYLPYFYSVYETKIS